MPPTALQKFLDKAADKVQKLVDNDKTEPDDNKKNQKEQSVRAKRKKPAVKKGKTKRSSAAAAPAASVRQRKTATEKTLSKDTPLVSERKRRTGPQKVAIKENAAKENPAASERKRRTGPQKPKPETKNTASATQTENASDLMSSNNVQQAEAKQAEAKKPIATGPSLDEIPDERSKIVMRRFATVCLAKGIEELIQEFNDLKVSCKNIDQLDHTTFDKNPEKNRYRDIICIDETRVRLACPFDSNLDYIHANWIKNMPDMMDKEFICTQGPTENTIEDFWRMVWQEKVAAIIMLCSVVESGKKKCEQYWPLTQDQSMTFGNLTITNLNVAEVGKPIQYTKLKITGPNNMTHVLEHVLYDSWPDKAVPLTSATALRLIFRTQSLSPTIVHCSAGVGRTGTIVGLEVCLRILSAGNELSVYNVIKELRARRFLSCQTDLQYLYIHRSILAFITSKNILSPEAVSNFVSDYETLVKSRMGS